MPKIKEKATLKAPRGALAHAKRAAENAVKALGGRSKSSVPETD
jgi:hypothetical protein